MENVSLADTARWQMDKLIKLIKYVSNNCEFYRYYNKIIEFTRDPIVDKTIIKDNYENINSKECFDNELHKMSTSDLTETFLVIM